MKAILWLLIKLAFSFFGLGIWLFQISLYSSGLFDSTYPDIQVTIAHMGAYEYDEFLNLSDDYPHLMMDTAFVFLPDYEGALHKDPEILEQYQDRILYGSDFPNIIFPHELEIETLMKYGLTKTTLQKILYDNGNRIIREIVNNDNR